MISVGGPSNGWKKSHVVALVGLVVIGTVGAFRWKRPSRAKRQAHEIVAALRARPASPLLFDGTFPSIEPTSRREAAPAGDTASNPTAHVSLPGRSAEPLRIENVGTAMAIGVQLRDVVDVAAEATDGYHVYPHAHRSGGTLLHRVLDDGVEDFVSFETRPTVAKVTYDLTLDKGVSGLRLVDETLEMLDGDGAPRLRVAPPFVVGADGARTDATLAVEGCAVDTNPAAPWGRAVLSPGASTCQVAVTWPDTGVAYPAVLDPRWTTTGSMTTTRQGHTATLLSTGNVLVVGGTSNGSTALASAEIYNRTTGTWAATNPMTGARTFHTATQLGTSSNSTTSGKVLISGGLNGTTSQNTAQLYSPSAGTWTAAANLNAARHGHTATALVDGRVLVTGGLNGTTTLNTAALYNPASGTGSWVATAGPLPSALKNHAAALLTTTNSQLSNKVLVFGGNSGSATVPGVYLFDPAQNAFSTQASLPSAREGHTVTVLANGNLLVTGGKSGTTTLATTVLFNPSSGSGSWSSAGTMTAARQAHSATLIPSTIVSSGQVLLAGGSNGSATLSSAELWNGTTTWTATTALLSAQQGHTATLLGNDAILIAGGVNGSATVSTSQLYDASFGLSCTSNSQCTTGFCVNGVCCDTACTNQCMACNLSGHVGTCTAKANGTTCSDGNACTQTDTCQSGTCTGGSPVTCHAQDQCHVAGTCNQSTGVCSNPNAANGTTCNDGNACTRTDTCQSGVCNGGNPVVCTQLDQCHVAGTCNQSTGACSNPTATNGTTCNDGNACTRTDTCQTGICTGGNPVVCAAGDQCHVPGSCNQTTGLCSNPTATNGAICNDGNSCTQGETCQSGACQANNNSPVVIGLPVDDLGNLGGGFAQAEAVNAGDHVVGVSSTATGNSHAFRWDGAGPMIDLGGLSGWPANTNATAIDDGGAIAGSAPQPDGSSHVFIDIEGPVDLGPGGDNSAVVDTFTYQGGYAYGIDDTWDLAGVMTVGGAFHGFLYESGVGFQDIGSLGGAWTWANGISPTGTVVGSSQVSGSPTTGYLRFGHAISYSTAIGLRDLNTFVSPIEGITLITANAANNFRIVGGAEKTGPIVPYRLDTNTGEVDLLSGGWQGDTVAYGLNDVGDTVGFGFLDAADTQQAAFVYTDQLGFKNLNDLIDPTSHWVLEAATGINASGDVVGWGTHNGQLSAFHLRVSPETVAGAEANTCGNNEGSLYLWSDGVVNKGNGTYVAVFGFNNSGTTGITPTTNQELINGSVVTNPNPTPPVVLPPGGHPGAFLPSFQLGQTVSWTVNGQTVTASAAAGARILPTTPLGTSGTEVNVEGTEVVVTPDLYQYGVPPANPPLAAEPSVNTANPFFGSTKGRLGVGPSGAATYTVPIAIPPGVAGLAPNIALTYNSQGDDGIAGQGWQLSGLSSIYRCPKTRADDGLAQSIRLENLEADATDGDGVCLDGQRLFHRGARSYELENDDFSSITLSIDETKFTVVTKGGQTRYYGLRPGSRVVINTHQASEQAQTQVAWLLDKVVDKFGNYYDVHYNNDNADFSVNGVIVTSIAYTGHMTGTAETDTGCPDGDECPPNLITFQYGPTGQPNRPDWRLTRFRDASLFANHRLTGITTPQGTYALTYLADDATLPSRLSTIQFCDGPTSVNAQQQAQHCQDPLTFGWDGGNFGYQPVPAPAPNCQQTNSYALPVPLSQHVSNGSSFPTGVQFVDLDGDGRVDLVQSRDQTDAYGAAADHAWYNTGSGWACKDGWALPDYLIGPDGKPMGTLIDMDGDGMQDLMVIGDDGKPRVYLNRIRTTGHWESANGVFHSTFPASWGKLNLNPASDGQVDTFTDIDGDGLADIVRQHGGDSSQIDVLLGTANGWVAGPAIYSTDGIGGKASSYRLQDINRDGLPDLVGNSPNGCLTAGIASGSVLINTGLKTGNSAWKAQNIDATLPSYCAERQLIGDIDGDGFYDIVEYYVDRDHGPFTYKEAAVFGTGSEFTIWPDTGSYTGVLHAYEISTAVPGGGELVDLNGDGLADLIVPPFPDANTQGAVWAATLFNTGNGWADPTGNTGPRDTPGTYSVPYAAAPNDPSGGSDFVDLDGDGTPDIVHASDSSGTFVTEAWLNTFRKPIISTFPNGTAPATEVGYETITTSSGQGAGGVYDDTATLAPNTTYLAAPIRVVSTVQTNAGLGTSQKQLTSYHYSSLRGSALGRGPQGFFSTSVTDPLGSVTTTTYMQEFPFTGLPSGVSRSYRVQPGDANPVTFESTGTFYCVYQVGSTAPPGTWPSCDPSSQATYPPGTSFFVFPAFTSTVETFETGTAADQTATNPTKATETTFVFDDRGNLTNKTETTTQTTYTSSGQPVHERWQGTITNDFGQPNTPTQLAGAAITTTTQSQRLEPAQFPRPAHVTNFAWDSEVTYTSDVDGSPQTNLILLGTTVEAGGGFPVLLSTTYLYDSYGNVKNQTSCDYGLGGCRTTTISFDPNDFLAPSGTGLTTSLPYKAGRFPVRKIDAAGHAAYFAYNPVFGTIAQTTDSNGVSSCTTYDSFGNTTAEIARCGSVAPLSVTTNYYHAVSTDPPNVATVAVVRGPAAGAVSFNYSDDLGRTVRQLSRNFNGGFTQSDTIYNALGQLYQQSQPSLVGTSGELFTTFQYDGLSRVKDAQADLGDIDGSGSHAVSDVQTTYQGPSVTTRKTVAGTSETRTETMNAIGKLATVQDAKGTITTYDYDGDGNRSAVSDVNNNTVQTVYDARNRPLTVTDPDMGTWTYSYDGFGDIRSRLDGAGQSISWSYDSIGRVTSRTDSTGTTQWIYDMGPGAGIGQVAAMIGPADSRSRGPCSLFQAPPWDQLVTANDGNRAAKFFSYNDFEQVKEVDECADGDTFTTKYQYDTLGRQSLLTYPQFGGQHLSVSYNYTNAGFLQYVADASTSSVLWAASAVDAFGHVTDEFTANGVETLKSINPSTGWLMGSSSYARADNSNVIQNWGYHYDEAGNLRYRGRFDQLNSAQSVETFQYDSLNRLTNAAATIGNASPVSEGYQYDSLGNLSQKGTNTYAYGDCSNGTQLGPHAVCSITDGSSFSYDGNGNMIAGRGRVVAYTQENKVTRIEAPASAAIVDFIYGADDNRVVQIALTPGSDGHGAQARTVYVGLGATGKSLYERTTTTSSSGTKTEHVHFIYASSAHGGNAFALRVVTDDGSGTLTSATKYNHFDNLGSITAMSDDVGHVVSAAWGGPDATNFGYDAWGARRNPDESAADPSSFNLQVGHREFSSHETIPGVGLVNMNGRVYDPELARFMSPDPNVQNPADLQSFNRYSYVFNNPLSVTDPTGYFSLSLGGIWSAIKTYGPGIACEASDGATCAVVGAVEAIAKVGAMLNSGASWQQVLPVGGLAFMSSVEGDLVNVDPSFLTVLPGWADKGIANKAGSTPIIGKYLKDWFAINPSTGVQWGMSDYSSWVHPAEEGAVIYGGMALTIASGGLSAPWMFAADTGIGFGEGFATAKLAGASNEAALEAGAVSAVISGATAILAPKAPDLAMQGLQGDAAEGDESAQNMLDDGYAQEATQPHAFPDHAAGEGNYLGVNDITKASSGSYAYGPLHSLSDNLPYFNYGGEIQDALDADPAEAGWGQWFRSFGEAQAINLSAALSSTGGSALLEHEIWDHQ